MSDSDTDPHAIQYRKTIFHATLLESFVNGIYFCILASTLYIMVSKKYLQTQKFLVTLLVFMYALATFHLAIRWRTIYLGFIVNGKAEDISVDFLENHVPQGLQIPASVAFGVNTILADCILTWRCWKVWGRDWRAPLFPTLATLAETFFAVITLIEQAQPNALSTSGMDPSIVYLTLSLVTTMLATSLIVFRVLYLSWQSGDIRRYHTIIEIIVESAALYAITLLIYIPLLPSTNFSDAYPQVIVVSMAGISSTLVYARVSLGWSRPDEQWKRTRQDTPIHVDVEVGRMSQKNLYLEKRNYDDPGDPDVQLKLYAESVPSRKSDYHSEIMEVRRSTPFANALNI